MIYEFKDINGPVTKTADVCVIGSGAGGAVAAKELSEKGLSVVLLEEGSRFSVKNYNQDPAEMMPMMWRGAGSTVTLGLPPVSLTPGKCLGGTTAINSATCFRTPDRIIRKWAEKYDCAGLEPQQLLPYFEKVEKEINVCELTEDILGKNYQIIKRGAKKIGLTAKPLKHNVKNCEGAGVCQFGCIKNAKQSTDVSYIPQADRFGATIYTNCRATSLKIEGGRVHGVKGRFINPATGKKGPPIEVHAKVVCLAMGTMMTPAFLLRHHLANTSGQVGRGLTIHPAGRVVAEMDEIVDGHHGVSQGGLIDDLSEEGITLEGIFISPGMMTMTLPGVGQEHKYLAKHYRHLAAFGVMVSDTTRGRVFRSVPGIPFLAWYSLNQRDTEKMRQGIACVAEIFFAARARRVFTGCFKMPVLNSVEELKKFKTMRIKPWNFEIGAFHPLGTCRMGHNPRQSVVDLNLESHDIKGLFIPDGCPFPSSLSVNPQVTIMAFATRAAEYIADNINRY